MREISKVTIHTVERKTSNYYDADLKWRFTVESNGDKVVTRLDMRFDNWKQGDLEELQGDVEEVLAILGELSDE